MGLIPTYLDLLETHPADAAVLVMPDIDGGQRRAAVPQQPGGIQDMTFVPLAPRGIARVVRVQPPGRAWGWQVTRKGDTARPTSRCMSRAATVLPA